MEKDALKLIDHRNLGVELQHARNQRGMTQAEAAQIIGASRTTITAIEKGARKIKPDELIRLAQAYGRKASDFVRKRPTAPTPQAQFRGPYKFKENENKEISAAVDHLIELSRRYFELEQISNRPLIRSYPEPYPYKRLQTDRAAEGIASRERNRLGLGDGPIPMLRHVLEQETGLRVFSLHLKPSKLSAIYIYDDNLGGCIAVNSRHPEERRRFSLAHDYGHFLTNRYMQKVCVDQLYERIPDHEQFADYFAFYFLMPTSGLTRKCNEIKNQNEKISSADLCILAHYYGVSFEALTRQLEHLKLLPTGTYEKLKERGLKVREAQKQLGLTPIYSEKDKFPVKYQYLAIDAYEEGLFSEGQLAHFLDTDRLTVREIIQQSKDNVKNMEKYEAMALGHP